MTSAATSRRYPSLAAAARFEPLYAQLSECEPLVAEVRAVRRAHGRETTSAERERLAALAEELGARLQGRLRAARELLRTLQAEDAEFAELHGSASVAVQIRAGLHSRAVRAYAATLRGADTELAALRDDLRARTERELLFVDPSLGAAQLDALVDSGHAAEFVRAHLVAESEAELRAAVAVIEQRQLGLRALERQVQRLAELFRDLADLVELQQESADVVERRLATTRAAAEQGEEQIGEAYKWQTKATLVRSSTGMRP